MDLEGKAGGEWVSVLGRSSNTPLSIVSENSVRLAECYKLLPGLWIFVYVRMELLAQLANM